MALATVTTAAVVTKVGVKSAASGGEVTADGGDAVTARGVCWKTVSGPTVADSKTANGTGVGVFLSGMVGLLPNTHYFVKAYATNGAGTAYGGEVEVTTQAVLSELWHNGKFSLGLIRSFGAEVKLTDNF